MRFIYTAKRNLATGHTVDTQYEIVIGGRAIDMSSQRVIASDRALDGTTETDLKYIDKLWNVTTGTINTGQDLENFEELIDSVSAGESFTFDPDGTQLGVPVNERTVELVSVGHRRQRQSPLSYVYPLQMREAA